MKQRAITAVFFAAAMLGGVYGSAYSFFVLFLVVTLGCLWELTEMLFKKDIPYRLMRRVTGVVTGVIPFFIYGTHIVFGLDTGILGVSGNSGNLITVVVVAEVLLLFALFIVELFLASKHPFAQIGYYLTGILYVGIPYTILLQIAFLTGEYGPHRVFGIMWLVWTNDVMAYLVGSKIGKNKLFERISPKKTWEGTLGGIVGTLLMAWLLSHYIVEYSPVQWLIVGITAAIFGSFGDLVESMLKRSVGVKDSGSIFPGHGGFLDRFDAFQFTIPFTWVALMLADYFK